MNALKSLNKEQWTAAAAVALGALMLLSGLAGGIAPAAELPSTGADEPYDARKPRYLELPDEKFDRYWQGRDIFKTDSTTRLPVPIFRAPEPREEEMPAPPFSPFPNYEAYNKLPMPGKYPVLEPGAPVVAEANLPPAAEVAALIAIEEPVVAARPDKRNEKEREFAIIPLKSGSKLEVLEITADNLPEYVFFISKEKQRRRVPRADVGGPILTNNTNEKQVQLDSEKIKPGPREVEERVKLAQRCLELGMMPESKAELKKVLELKKDSVDAVLLLGQIAVESSDFETALAAYRGGIDAGGPAGELWHEIGKCLRQLSFHEGALGAFEKAVESQPRLHRARVALARAYLDVGQVQSAIDAGTDFFTKLGAAPDTTPAQRAEAWAVRGVAYVRAGQLEKARADFAETLKVDPQNAEAINGLGASLAIEGKYPAAAPEFVKAIKAGQYQIEAWTNLATLYLLGGKWTEAEQLSAAALQRDPSSVEAALALGLAQLLAAKKEGPASIEAAAKMDPRSLPVLMTAGLLRLREGQDEEALSRFIGALRREYHFLPAYSGAAAAYLRTARALAATRDEASSKKAAELRVNAETLLRAVRDFDPNRGGIWVALGCAYAVMQRPDDARLALRQAASIVQKGEPIVSYTLGYLESYYGAGETEEARLDAGRREFEQAVKLKATATDRVSQRVIAECEAAIEQIDQWKRTKLQFLEEFSGADAKMLGGGWLQNQGQGLAITRAGGKARIAGKQAIRDWALTSLLRDVPGDEFQSMEISFYPEKTDKTEFGASLFYQQTGGVHSGFQIGIDGAGKVRFNAHMSDRDMDGRDMATGWTEVKLPLPNPKEITIRLSKIEKNRVPQIVISFYDAAKSEWVPVNKDGTAIPTSRGTWRVGAWVRAWRDQDVLLSVDNIKVLDQSRR